MAINWDKIRGNLQGGSSTTVKSKLDWNKIRSRLPESTKIPAPVTTNEITQKKLSESIGGGSFYQKTPQELVRPEKVKKYGGLESQTGSQRDHIIPWALGGDSTPVNVKYRDLEDALLKDKIAMAAINDYKAGRISLAEARSKVLDIHQQLTGLRPTEKETTVKGQFLPALKETTLNTLKGVFGLLSPKSLKSGETIESIGTVASLPFKAIEAAEKTYGALPEYIAGKTGAGKEVPFAEAYKKAPTIGGVITEGLDELTKIARGDKERTTLDYFMPEFIGLLADAGVETALLAPIGTRIATRAKVTEITPEQMTDVMTGRTPRGKPLSPETTKIVKEELLKPETAKDILKEATRQGVKIKTTEPAGAGRQLLGEYLGGGASSKKSEVLIGGKKIEPKVNWETVRKQITTGEVTPQKIQDLNKKLNIENTKKVKEQTLAGQREQLRLTNEKELQNLKDTTFIKSDSTPDTIIPIYRAAKEPIKAGDQITVREDVAKNYAKQRKDSALQTLNVELKDLVKAEGTRDTFVYAPLKASKVAMSIQSKAIEKGLTEKFEEIAGYEPRVIKEQAEKISTLLKENPESAKNMIKNLEPIPGDISGTYLIKAIEDYAFETGDIGLLQDIARSPLISETSRYGSEIRMLAERDPQNIVKIMQEVKQVRSKNLTKEKLTAEQKKIQREVKAVKKSQADLEDFIKSIIC